MTETSEQPRKRSAFLAIAVGGLAAGAIDMTQATVLFGWGVWPVVASALFGPAARQGGVGMTALGLLLHFFIATSAAAIYYAASRRLLFLVEYPLICGLFFGMAVNEVMNLVVLPLSALHARGPYGLSDLLTGIGVHMLTIGLPIAFATSWFGPRR